MSLGLSTTLRNNRAAAIAAAIDGGDSGGVWRIYDGTRPATGAAITTQNLLAEGTFADPGFTFPSTGVLTANPINTDPSANNTGTASWFRILDSNGTFVMDGNVGLSGTDMVVNTLNVVTNKPFAINSMILTEGNA